MAAAPANDAKGVTSAVSTVGAAVVRAPKSDHGDLIAHKPRVHLVSAAPASMESERVRLAAAYACLDCDADSPFVAQSAAEGAWMSDHGFPTQEQLQSMHSLDRSRLRALADQGNAVAAGLLGTILLKEGRGSEGSDYLSKARQHGSIYALYGLSDWLRSEDNPNPQPYLAAAYIRLAYLLGDTNAAEYLYTNFPNMDRYALIDIDRQASAILRRMQLTNAPALSAQSPNVIRPDPKEDAYLQDFDWNQ